MHSLTKLTIDLCRAGYGTIKDIDAADFESLMEIVGYQDQAELEDEVLQEIRRERGRT